MKKSGFLKLSKTSKAMCISLSMIFLVLLTIGLLVIWFVYPFEAPLKYLLGLLLGTASSFAKIILMEKSLNKTFDMEHKDAKNYAGLMSTLRYFLTIAVFGAVILFKNVFGLFGTIAGVLALQLSAYGANYLLRNVSPEEFED